MRTALVVAAVALAALGASAQDAGVTDTRVLLGQPAAFSGPSAGLGVEFWRGADAAFEAFNEAGGVHGRRVELALADDAYDAEKAAAAVRRLATEDRVFALFGGVGTPTIVRALPVVLELHKKEGLFYFANFTGAQPQREPPYDVAVFNVRASYRQETETIVARLVGQGRRKIGVFVQDDAYGQSGRDGVQRALKARGLELAGDATYPRGQTWDVSTAAQVAALKAAGVEAVVAVGAYQACAAFVRDARGAGLAVPIYNVSFVGADQMLALLRGEEKRSGRSLTTELFNTQVVPSYLDGRVPIVQSYRAAMDRHAQALPKAGDGSYRPQGRYSFGSLEGYASARAFLWVLSKTGRELTRKAFYGTAEATGAFDIGLGTPLQFSPGRHQALDKVWLTHVTDAGWATLN